MHQDGKLDINKIKDIVATFLEISPNEVSEKTLIGRDVIQGSARIHRLRSELKKQGVDIPDWENISCVGDLTGNRVDLSITSKKNSLMDKVSTEEDLPNNIPCSVGIDIESIEVIPDAEDFYTEQFFLDNFSKKEIAYCTRQNNSRRCFAGRFAIKEAIFKATNGLCGNDFSKVEIEKKSDGSIMNDLCSISISYLNSQEKEICVAVAVATNKNFIDSKSIKPSDSIEDPFSKVSNKSIENNTKCGKDNLLWIGFILLLVYILIRDIGITLN